MQKTISCFYSYLSENFLNTQISFPDNLNRSLITFSDYFFELPAKEVSKSLYSLKYCALTLMLNRVSLSIKVFKEDKLDTIFTFLLQLKKNQFAFVEVQIEKINQTETPSLMLYDIPSIEQALFLFEDLVSVKEKYYQVFREQNIR